MSVPPTVYVGRATLLEEGAALVAPLLDEPAAVLVAPLLLESAMVLVAPLLLESAMALVAPLLLESAMALVAPLLLESATVLVAPLLLESATVLVAPLLLESAMVLVALPLEDPPAALVPAPLVAPLDGPPDDDGRRLLLIPALAAEEDPTFPLEELEDDELSSVFLGPQPTAREAASATTVSDGLFKRVRVLMSTSNGCPAAVLPQQGHQRRGRGLVRTSKVQYAGRGKSTAKRRPTFIVQGAMAAERGARSRRRAGRADCRRDAALDVPGIAARRRRGSPAQSLVKTARRLGATPA
jgi:hypothetical protein